MVNYKVIEDYDCLIKTIDDFLSEIQGKNTWQHDLMDLVETPIIKELSKMTGHLGSYFIHSSPNGNKFDITKIKKVREKILFEIEEYGARSRDIQ